MIVFFLDLLFGPCFLLFIKNFNGLPDGSESYDFLNLLANYFLSQGNKLVEQNSFFALIYLQLVTTKN